MASQTLTCAVGAFTWVGILMRYLIVDGAVTTTWTAESKA